MLSEIGLGLSALSSLSGLLGASSAAKAAEARRQAILGQLRNDNAREYMDVVSGNQYGLGARSGELNDALRSEGSSLGAANAAAGVTNNSATSGSLGLASQGISKTLSDYALRNKFQEQQLLGQQQRDLSGMELGVANNNVDYQRNNLSGAIGGFGNLLQGIGQLGRGPNANPEQPQDLSHGLLPPGVSVSEFGDSGGYGGGLQSGLQTMTQSNRNLLGGMDARTMGDMVNGGQGAKIPKLKYGQGFGTGFGL